MRIAIAWNGLPFYATRSIRAGIERVDVPVDLIGSRPSVPIEGMEEELGQPVHWIQNEEACSWENVGLPVPDLFIHTGWRYKGFNTLGREVRRNGGSVVSMVDNRCKNSVRQWVGALVFRIWYRRWFDAVWVPGASGRQLCQFLGMPDEHIYDHLYGIDPGLFEKGPPLHERQKTMLFVGQLIPRKGIDLLLQAFRRFRMQYPDWTLRIIGEGEIDISEKESGVEVEGFLQPDDVAQAMRTSRFLVLPSREDHWPLVVCESALSGCGLILSEAVGCRPEVVTPKNGIVCESDSASALEAALREAATKDQMWLAKSAEKSRELALEFTPGAWANAFEEIIQEYGR
jgi:glycosyltransferase involved in cell wall biosynthesis